MIALRFQRTNLVLRSFHFLHLRLEAGRQESLLLAASFLSAVLAFQHLIERSLDVRGGAEGALQGRRRDVRLLPPARRSHLRPHPFERFHLEALILRQQRRLRSGRAPEQHSHGLCRACLAAVVFPRIPSSASTWRRSKGC